MASDGSKGPRPWTQRRASTVFLRVPRAEWDAVRLGYKREFRAGSGANAVPQLWGVTPPTLVVAYSIDQVPRHHGRLMVLEEMWQEPLGAISAESLANEGCKDLAEFRTRWMAREHKRFRPTRNVFVYRVRLATLDDVAEHGERTVQHLYGQFLPSLEAEA